MDDEFNKNDISNLTVEEVSSYDETKAEVNNDKTCVEGNDLETTQIKSKQKSKDISQMISKITSGFMVTAVAAVAIVIPTVTSNTKNIDVTIEFKDAIVTDTTVSCGVMISDYTLADFTLVLSNNFTNRSYEIDDYDVDYFIEGLKPNMTYTLEVLMPGSFGSSTTLTKMDIKTLTTEDYRTIRFNDVKEECKCHIDGYFYFTMDYVDHVGLVGNFKAYLEDSLGNRSECVFNDDYHSEQRILVTDVLSSTETKALFVVTCDILQEDGTVMTIEAYRLENVSI